MKLLSSGRRRFELRDDQTVVGRLDRLSVWRSRYRASSADGSWLIHRSGIFNPDLIISDWYSDRQIAMFKPAGRDVGTLLLDDGAHHLRLTTAMDQPAKRHDHPIWHLRIDAAGTTTKGHAAASEHPLLLLLTAVILLEHFGRAPLFIDAVMHPNR